MDQLYIEIEISSTRNGESQTEIFTSVPSFLALYVFRFLNTPDSIKLNFVRSPQSLPEAGRVQLRTELLRRELTERPIICKEAATVSAIQDLRLPIYEKDGDTYIAGVCAVCRELIARQNSQQLSKLLGFKSSCLQAPSEASVWTRFCEVDLVRVVSEVLSRGGANLSEVPIEVVRFEKHLNEPVRMHNIYKQARDQANLTVNGEKIKRKERVLIECTVPKEDLLIKHRFAEGVNFTIADLILYPMFKLIFRYFSQMLKFFPLTSTWLSEIESFEPKCALTLNELNDQSLHQINDIGELTIPNCKPTLHSLYKADPKRYKPRNRVYTTQSEVDIVLSKLSALEMEFTADCQQTYGEQLIDWNQIEPKQHAMLPQERLIRKRQQLENMVNAVDSLAKPGYRIIDFCSGTGHLAILLALKLPKCTVIIMENKPFSLAQAKKRASELKLLNCRFYQCNIDYFVGSFDVGASLHACGTATDIVLQQCRRVKARFVCCPCCYGSLQSMPHIVYPLSNRFRKILHDKDYLYIAHAADQAHELGTPNCKPETSLQGQRCMSIVDTDRKFKAEEAGYKVILTRLKPEQCTPKNHLLVGYFVGVS